MISAVMQRRAVRNPSEFQKNLATFRKSAIKNGQDPATVDQMAWTG